VGHGVGGGTDADPAFGDGFAVAGDAVFGVESLRDPGGGVCCLPVAHGGQPIGEFLVDCFAVVGG